MDTVIVASSQFYSHYPKRIPKGTVNAEQVEIRLDSEWDGLTVRIHWLNVASGVEKVVLLERDQPNTIPWEVLTDLGELRMGLVGLDGETVIKPTIWLTYGYVVDGVDPESGSDPQPPTPSWEQQMVALAEAAANAAKAAKETADNLQASAEAGEFNGDPGPAGPPGKSPIIRNGTWWIWNNDSQDYTDTGVVASGGGGGVSSYNDLSDRPTIGGVLLEGNKTAQDLGLQPKGDYATTSSKLANPFFITFTGAVEAAYDGSKAVTVTIPTIAGPPGVSPTVSTEEIDGGTRVIFTYKGGYEPVDILNGKTPVKGIDYFTEAEKQEIAEQAAALVPGGGGTSTGGWKLLRVYTLKEAVSKIFFDKSDDGSEFSCDVILVKARAISDGNIKSITFGVQDAIGYGTYAIGVPDCLHPTSGSANWLNVYFESAPFAVRAEAFYYQYNDGLDNSPVVQRSSAYRDNNSTSSLAPFPGENGLMSSVCLCCWRSGTAGTFGAESYFEFWGHCV